MIDFLDPKRPLNTCKEKGCEDCNVRNSLVCHFNISQLAGFLLCALPLFVVGFIGIYAYSFWALLVWLGIILSYFMFIEIRVMCSHCPHYAEPETRTLKCWANYGAPKIWKYRPGPMSFIEKAIFFGGLFLIFFYPFPFIILQSKWILTIIYAVLLVTDTILLRNLLCTRCMNFACPLNRVDKETRVQFFEHNPVVKEAWKNNV